MKNRPAHPVPTNRPSAGQPVAFVDHGIPDCPDRTTVELSTAELARVAELFDLIDGFLRCGNGVTDRLTDYLHTSGRDHPRPQDQTSYDANLVIDLVSFTAHSLRGWRLASSEVNNNPQQTAWDPPAKYL